MAMPLHRCVIVLLLCLHLHATESAAPTADAAAAPAGDGWTLSGRVALQAGNVTSGNSGSSRDPVIAHASQSASWRGLVEGKAAWKRDADSVDHLLKVAYGRIRQQNQPERESTDEVRYDGVYRRAVATGFAYTAWGVQTACTGPDPDNDPLTPFKLTNAAGLGQRFTDFVKETSNFEWRLGLRTQKTWAECQSDEERRVQGGPEAFLRYDQDVLPRTDPFGVLVRVFAQIESFAESRDLGHVTNLVTNGLTTQLNRSLSVMIALRAYYETRPEGAADGASGYNQWSLRQETLVGLTCLF